MQCAHILRSLSIKMTPQLSWRIVQHVSDWPTSYLVCYAADGLLYLVFLLLQFLHVEKGTLRNLTPIIASHCGGYLQQQSLPKKLSALVPIGTPSGLIGFFTCSSTRGEWDSREQ